MKCWFHTREPDLQPKGQTATEEERKPTVARFTKIVVAAISATLAIVVARPSLAAVVTNVFIPQAFTFIDPCNDHALASTGTLHVVASTTFDSAGVQAHILLNEQEFKDTDLVTGAVCADTTSLNESGLNFDFSTDTVTALPSVVTVKFKGTAMCGSEGGFLFEILAHATINPDGKVTVLFDNSSNPKLTCIKSGG
jgi:hypothetical protein